MSSFHIRPVTPADAATWLRLRTAHWPDGAADHGPEIAAFFAGTARDPQAVFLAEYAETPTKSGRHSERSAESLFVVALMELSIRIDLAPLPNVKVGYVEGFYIVPEFRGRGLARQLLRFAQDWARQQHCPGFASDRSGRIIFDPHYRSP